MAALKYLVDLDLGGNELQNAALQTLASDPTTNLTIGRIFYNTAADAVFVYDGTGFNRVGLTADGTTITESSGTISVGTIQISNVNGLQTALDSKLEAADLSGYATETYVNNAISDLVDAAPATLDTLNELAAALGDDPNFATTITNAIGQKLDSSAYTAADVFAKVLTLDGTGSGLDADLLDGNEGSHYLDWNNFTNKPTLGALAALDSVNGSTIDDNSVSAAELNVSGNGSAGQFLASDGDGSMTWTTPTDTQYTAGGGLVLNGTEFKNLYNSVQVSVTGYAGGTYSIDISTILMRPEGLQVQVYEDVSGTRVLRMTSVELTGNTLAVTLTAGDFFIQVSGQRL